MSLTKRQFGALALGALLSPPAIASSAATGTACAKPTVTLAQATQNLIRAYPDFLSGAQGNELIWRNGARMPIQLYPLSRTPAEKLEQPDLAAQLTQSYPAGDCALPTDPADDPGRIRYAPFFARMYGEDRKSVV